MSMANIRTPLEGDKPGDGLSVEKVTANGLWVISVSPRKLGTRSAGYLRMGQQLDWEGLGG